MANSIGYGFVDLRDVFSERVTSANVEVVWKAIQETVAVHTSDLDAVLSAFMEKTTVRTQRFMLPASATLQPLDDKGNPVPIAPTGYYDIAFPIQGGGTAYGDNRVSRQKLTIEEANRRTLTVTDADTDWMLRHLLAGVYSSTAWTFNDPEGDITIQTLANGDSVTYLKRDGVRATDTHYLAQASAIDNSNNPYDDIWEELAEHPSNNVTDSTPVVVYIPADLEATTTALSAFYPANSAFVKPGISSTIGLDTNAQFGAFGTYIGVVNNCIVRRWNKLASGYIVAHALGAGPFLKFREHPEAALQGLFTEKFSPDGNLEESRFIRYGGFGVANRVAALVYRIGNGTYAVPSGYTAPLPA